MAWSCLGRRCPPGRVSRHCESVLHLDLGHPRLWLMGRLRKKSALYWRPGDGHHHLLPPALSLTQDPHRRAEGRQSSRLCAEDPHEGFLSTNSATLSPC